jgi:hypothetical protein
MACSCVAVVVFRLLLAARREDVMGSIMRDPAQLEAFGE